MVDNKSGRFVASSAIEQPEPPILSNYAMQLLKMSKKTLNIKRKRKSDKQEWPVEHPATGEDLMKAGSNATDFACISLNEESVDHCLSALDAIPYDQLFVGDGTLNLADYL